MDQAEWVFHEICILSIWRGVGKIFMLFDSWAKARKKKKTFGKHYCLL